MYSGNVELIMVLLMSLNKFHARIFRTLVVLIEIEECCAVL